MNKEFKRNILNAIKNNYVKVHESVDDGYYVYTLYGKNNRELMQVEMFDGPFPRATITINGERVAGVNHFARTPKQIQTNYDVFHIVNKMFDKYAEQNGLIKTSMNKKQFAWSMFLRENSIKKR